MAACRDIYVTFHLLAPPKFLDPLLVWVGFDPQSLKNILYSDTFGVQKLKNNNIELAFVYFVNLQMHVLIH